jgi:hypothetical protein
VWTESRSIVFEHEMNLAGNGFESHTFKVAIEKFTVLFVKHQISFFVVGNKQIRNKSMLVH